VPLPCLVMPKAPLTLPLTVRELAELFVQLWLAPRATSAAMTLPAYVAVCVMPAAFPMVSL
jgi:hypothetical protein